MRLHRRLPAVLAAGAAVAVLVGCTADSPKPQAAPSPTAPPVEAVLRAAAAETDDQGSSRYSLTTATTVNGAEVVFAGEGVYDWAKDTGQTTYETPVGSVQQRLVGPALFLALPQQPGIFYKLKSADVASSPVGGTVDPTAQLHTLAAVSAAEVVGQEEVRGEKTTHYRGTYDVARALRGARGLQQAALRSSLGAAATGVPQAPYDVFLDAEGRLRRLTQTVEVPSATGDPLSVTTTLELYDFGIPVTVVTPPGAVQRDGTPFLAALRQALPQPSTSPSPSPSTSTSPSAR
jgi:hypothetical protein